MNKFTVSYTILKQDLCSKKGPRGKILSFVTKILGYTKILDCTKMLGLISSKTYDIHLIKCLIISICGTVINLLNVQYTEE